MHIILELKNIRKSFSDVRILNGVNLRLGKGLVYRLKEGNANGKSRSDRKLSHCIRAAYTFSEDRIRYAASTQLTIRYYTQLPDKKLLNEKLQRAIAIAKEHHAKMYKV
jgi:ABC-type sugar transport system ATPase subunit